MESNKREFNNNPSGDEVVITGISGRFPNSRTVTEFGHNLYNKIDMVDEKNTRWTKFNDEIPQRMGKISDLEKFDTQFFRVPFTHAMTMDPQIRMLVEHAYEAIMDAGINPQSLRGSKTGVYVGACQSETEKMWIYEKNIDGLAVMGCNRGMFANRISYCLGLEGPSICIDTACSSSTYALDIAFKAIQNGEIDAALVGGSNIILHPQNTLAFAKLGVLSPDGICRPFSFEANGYNRAEAISVIFLQRAKHAKRIYATIMHTKTNCDGFKANGITYPSRRVQQILLEEFYNEIKIHPNEIDYMEAHSTGTVAGDPEECAAIDAVICSRRTTPLLIGSVKSNMGHSEPAAGLCSMAKVILSLESGLVPPNLNITKIRNIPALVEDRLKVCIDVTKLSGPMVAINSFGFGGANAHCLLYGNTKRKLTNKNDNQPILPTLVLWCGRTEQSIMKIMNGIENQTFDTEFIGLLHNSQNVEMTINNGNSCRGFGVFISPPSSSSTTQNAICVEKQAKMYIGENRPLVWVYSGMGSQWCEMGVELMKIPSFMKSIEKSHEYLLPFNVDLKNIVTTTDPHTFDNILHSFVGICAIQIAITDILRMFEIKPDYIIGHSVGELGCAYADQCFTHKEMILSAYARGLVSIQTKVIKGAMAAIGLSYEQILPLLPSNILVACHNSSNSCTISGPINDVYKFVNKLKENNIFAKEVAVSNIPYHSKYVAEMAPKLLNLMKKLNVSTKKRSNKWLCTSVPINQWNFNETGYSSPEYHANNLLSPVYFEETCKLLPTNAVVIEIAPHGLLQAILKVGLPKAVNIPLTHRAAKDNVIFFLTALGKLHMEGVFIPISRLYPPVQFPVSRGTPMISPLIEWDHSYDHFVALFGKTYSQISCEKSFIINLNDSEYEYIRGHTIDGRCIIPATAYLNFAWHTLAEQFALSKTFTPVEFNDIKFIRATYINDGQTILLRVILQIGTGSFEILDGKTTIVTGYIKKINDNTELIKLPSSSSTNDYPILNRNDFYKELRVRGYHYSGEFQSIIEARSDGLCGKVKWTGNYISFMDCLLQLYIISYDTRNIILPVRVERIRIVPNLLNCEVGEIIPITICESYATLLAGSVEITQMHTQTVLRRKPAIDPILETYQFIPYFNKIRKFTQKSAITICLQLILENLKSFKNIRIVEFDGNIAESESLIINTDLIDVISDIPLILVELILVTSKDELKIDGVQICKSINGQNNCSLIIGRELFKNELVINEAINTNLINGGFLLTCESTTLSMVTNKWSNLQLISTLPCDTNNEIFQLYRLVNLDEKKRKNIEPIELINCSMIDDNDFNWLEEIKQAKIGNKSIMVYSAKNNCSGILGFVNCIRREPNGQQIRCIFVDNSEQVPVNFNLTDPFYLEQINLELAINIYKNGEWGSYRHLKLENVSKKLPRTENCILNVLNKGDLSSLSWFQGKPICQQKKNKINVHYMALNFRDIMLATGRISPESFNLNRLECENILGFEYSGINEENERIMGTCISETMGSQLIPDTMYWKIPTEWSLAEAATVPVVYVTVYMAFFQTNPIQRGKTILIHAGSGGVGLAAIRVALAYGIIVYTTVSTEDKQKYLLKEFPELKASHIGNSRDCSFEQMIKLQTNGRGVDYVLNSLSGDKLIASLRCLGERGVFLEIGKFDMTIDTKIGMSYFLKEISIRSVMADKLFNAPNDEGKIIQQLIDRDIKNGIIKPLKTNIFNADDIEIAYRLLSSGKHIGKVLIKIRDTNSIKTLPIHLKPQLYFNDNNQEVFIIVGGLGGFGLEFIDWLIIRGARKIMISSSRGITNSYQAYRIKTWQNYGCKIIINTEDITNEQGCQKLLREAEKMGQIIGIFNLAVILNDGILENQTIEQFKQSFGPKAWATKWLDRLSRKMCPKLLYFIVFSSISCGYGNAGQSNYGMANSIMERIIEQRVTDNLPGKAIQWGAIGEVGSLVNDDKTIETNKIDLNIGGTIQQRLSSCFMVLDELITIDNQKYPIVTSMIVAQKNIITKKSITIFDRICNVFGIRDIKTVPQTRTFADMGMDSLMLVELKQIFERDFDIILSNEELRELTLLKLHKIFNLKNSENNLTDKEVNNSIHSALIKEIEFNKKIISLNSIKTTKNLIIFIFPGIEGIFQSIWIDIGKKLKIPTTFFQIASISNGTTIPEIINDLKIEISNLKLINKNNTEFILIGHSYGSVISLELSRFFENNLINCQLIAIDGSPSYIKSMTSFNFGETKLNLSNVLIYIGQQIFDSGLMIILKEKLNKCQLDNDKKIIFLELFKNNCNNNNNYSDQYVLRVLDNLVNRILSIYHYKINEKKVNTKVTLIRSTKGLANMLKKPVNEDYGWSTCTNGPIDIVEIVGDHNSILENSKLLDIIHNICDM